MGCTKKGGGGGGVSSKRQIFPTILNGLNKCCKMLNARLKKNTMFGFAGRRF